MLADEERKARAAEPRAEGKARAMQVELKVPAVGESVSEVEIGEWKKAKGDRVQRDEVLVVLESEKANVDLSSPVTGVLVEHLKKKGDTAKVGEIIGYIDEDVARPGAKPSSEPAPEPRPGAALEIQAPQGVSAAERALAEKDLRPAEGTVTGLGAAPAPQATPPEESGARALEAPTATGPAAGPPLPRPEDARRDEVVPMTRLRRTVAERLVQAQQGAALLTTFNEIDMSAVAGLRREFGEAFQAKHGTKLGFMSFFVKATVEALLAIPQVNAEIRGRDIVYHRYCDIGIAVGGGKGLVVPVLRNAERLNFAEVELAIADFARRARENKLKPDELQGGTFTISNGGVYGSLLSTPIVNPPQSGVLGMHAIQERPVAREGQVVIRPMMYVALTYDHRLIDGREAVTFLKRIKDLIENPVRLLIGL